MKLQYIDPPECGCTDCLTGLAVPLDRATNTHVSNMLVGVLTQRIGELEMTVSYEAEVTEDELRGTWNRSNSFIDFVRPGDLVITIFDYRFRI